jgi:hypothetical protein
MTANWTELTLGIWLIVSPWLLGFSSISVMKWSNLMVGLLLVLINVWIIFGKKRASLPSEEPKSK